MDDKNRQKALELAIASVEKEFGKGAIMRLKDGAEPRARTSPVVPTGSLGLDIALGIGGYPRGRIVEIYGPESSGKTTLTLHAIANVQRQGGVAAFIDAEHALDVDLRQEARREDGRAAHLASPTTASRRSRSPTCSCAPARSTSSSSTRSRRSCPRPRSKATWATATSASRRAS